MAPQRQWVFAPNSGGKTITDTVKRQITERIQRYAEQHFAGKFMRLGIRYKAQFCYIDAYSEPAPLGPNWSPAGFPETREAYLARLRNTPTRLCRLRYRGDMESWGFAFYTYSHNRYELSMFPSGGFFGKPEEAFETAANVYLS